MNVPPFAALGVNVYVPIDAVAAPLLFDTANVTLPIVSPFTKPFDVNWVELGPYIIVWPYIFVSSFAFMFSWTGFIE